MAQGQLPKDDFEPDDFEPDDDFEADDFEPESAVSTQSTLKSPESIFIKEEKDPNRSLMQRLTDPLLLEMQSGKPNLLSSGIDVGSSIPGLNKIWPGGIHIPGMAEVYNEFIRPMSSPIGLALGGLEGAINRFSTRIPSSTGVAEEQLPALKNPVETSLQVPEPKIGTPPFNTSQFGLKPTTETLPYPQNIVPNKLRAPSTNATVFDALLPESLKLNEQGAALPPTISLKNPSLTQEPVSTKSGKYTFLDETIQKAPSATVESEVIPRAGQAKSFTDIGALTANVTSPDQTLSSRPVTKPIADLIITAQDKKVQWIASTERELSELSEGLGKNDRVLLGKLIDGQELPNAPLELQERANRARVILDQVHEMFPEGATRSGGNVGYLENYFTHIQHQPENFRSAVSNILDHHFGIFKRKAVELAESEGEGIGDHFETGLGRPSSPFVEQRTGNNTDLQYDVNKVFPAYIESAAKVIFDKPAVEAATRHLDKIPDSNLKELASWYIKNYSRYDAEKGLSNAWRKWTNSIARTTARSLLGFNTGLQTLHLARVPANLYPELGAKYTLYGLKQLGSNPIQTWTESARLGLLQNEIRPFSFRTPLEKFDSISNFLSMADYVDKTAGYFGYKKKFMDMGLGEEEASLKAIRETKRVSQTSDPARQMMITRAKGGNALAHSVTTLGTQFKQVPAKIVEQYIKIASEAKSNPKQAARLLAGVGLVLGANEGLRTFHLDPMHMIPTSVWGAFGDTVSRVVYNLSKGNWEKALEETALWATPGGKSLQRQIKQGPSAIQ